MAANFPTSAPALKTNYADNTDDVMAANQNQPNLEVNAIASKVGIDNSTDATSLDYKGKQVSTSPTDLKLSVASKGGVFNGDFELGNGSSNSSVNNWVGSENYGVRDNSNRGTGSLTTSIVSSILKIVYNNVTNILVGGFNTVGGVATLGSDSKFMIPVTASTKYRFSVKYKLTGTANATTKVLRFREYSSKIGSFVNNDIGLSVNNEFTISTSIVTLNASTTFLNWFIYFSAESGSGTLEIDWIKIEPITEDTSFTGKIAEKIRPVFQAVTSTDNIDQSLDTGGEYANTYALTTAVNEGATHLQTFTPTKKYITQIGVWPVATGTGVDWTLVVHTAGNVIVASKTIAAASVATGAMMYFDVPNIWTSGALHFHLYASATTGTPTCKANTSDDLETASFIQRYAKKTEEFTLVSNGIKTQLKADKDGLLAGAIIDLDNGKYRYNTGLLSSGTRSGLGANTKLFVNNVFSATAGSQPSATAIDKFLNNWNNYVDLLNARFGQTTDIDTIIFKVNTIFPIKHLKLTTRYGTYHSAAAGTSYLYISKDNINWTLIDTRPFNAHGNPATIQIDTDVVNGGNVFYLKFEKPDANTSLVLGRQKWEADLDTSKIPQGLFYPLGENRFTETVKLPASATRVYFRKNKFTNENGVIMPALEYTDASANYIGYTPLKLDNSQETNPCVDIITAETTNGQQSGTGSNDSTTGYILNDGEYMTLSTAVDELKIVFKVGTGTTTFANITKNALYLSSNGDSDDATQDPSHQGNFIVGVRQQGLTQKMGDVQDEIQTMKRTMPMIRTVDITVLASASTGTAEVPRDSIIIGCVPISNQDQFVDSCLISGTTITITLAAAATADNKFRVTYF